MRAISVLLAVFVCISAKPQFNRVKNSINGVDLYQDVLVDKEENYVMITTTPGNNEVKASVNLHDLAMGFSAVKDINTGVCYIDKSEHTMQQLIDRVTALNSGLKTPGLKEYNWNCDRKPMLNTFLRRLAGDRIAEFCKDYSSKLIDRYPVENVVTGLSMRRQYGCFICTGGCNSRGREQPQLPKETAKVQ